MLKKSSKLIIIIVILFLILLIGFLGIFLKTSLSGGSSEFNGLTGHMEKTFYDLNGSYTIAEAELQDDSKYSVSWSIRVKLKKIRPDDIKIIAYDGDGCEIHFYSNKAKGREVSFRENIEDAGITLHKGKSSVILLGNKLIGELWIEFESWEK